jgi:hypothetical protein
MPSELSPPQHDDPAIMMFNTPQTVQPASSAPISPVSKGGEATQFAAIEAIELMCHTNSNTDEND